MTTRHSATVVTLPPTLEDIQDAFEDPPTSLSLSSSPPQPLPDDEDDHLIIQTTDYRNVLDHDEATRRARAPDPPGLTQTGSADLEQTRGGVANNNTGPTPTESQHRELETDSVEGMIQKRKQSDVLIAVFALLMIALWITLAIMLRNRRDPKNTEVLRNPGELGNPGELRNTSKASGSLSKFDDEINGPLGNSLFGSSLALSADGTVMAVGAPGFNTPSVYNQNYGTYDNAGNQNGQVQVYKLLGDVKKWVSYEQPLTGTADGDLFGTTLALSGDGDLLTVGAPRSSYGYARIFKSDGANWTTQSSYDSDYGTFYGSYYEQIVAVSSNGVIALRSAATSSASGTVRLFQWYGSAWGEAGVLKGYYAGEIFGSSVSFADDGSRIAVADPFPGKVRIFHNVNGDWERVGNDVNMVLRTNREIIAVALSADGSTFAMGDPSNGEVSAYHYDSKALDWAKVGKGVTNEKPFSKFGQSISLSSDGLTLAIGAPGDSNNGHLNAGLVQVYGVTNDVWTQIGSDLYGERDKDGFGFVVALSEDGSTLAVGAPTASITSNFGSPSTLNTGYVRVYHVKR